MVSFPRIPMYAYTSSHALCTLTGIQFPGNNNLGRGGKG